MAPQRQLKTKTMSDTINDKQSTEDGGAVGKPAVMDRSFFRPKTRGELLEALKRGVVCEVAGHVAEFTSLCLTGWLRFDRFKVVGSPNRGWVLYESLSTGP